MSKHKNSQEMWEFVHRMDSLAIKKQKEEIERLKEEYERLRASSFVTAVPCEVYEELKAENELLKRQVNYWRIEAEVDHGRWLRTLEDLEHLRRLK